MKKTWLIPLAAWMLLESCSGNRFLQQKYTRFRQGNNINTSLVTTPAQPAAERSSRPQPPTPPREMVPVAAPELVASASPVADFSRPESATPALPLLNQPVTATTQTAGIETPSVHEKKALKKQAQKKFIFGLIRSILGLVLFILVLLVIIVLLFIVIL